MEEQLYPITFEGERYHKDDCDDLYIEFYTCREALNAENGVYVSEGMWVYPDGTMLAW